MRVFVGISASVLAAALAGCAATRQEVADNLSSMYLGKNVDALVAEFGPPASTFRMNSGEMAYVWQLSAVTSIDVDKGRGTAKTNYCRVNVIASPTGVVAKLTTEDASGTGGIPGLVDIDIYGSICARRLGMRRGG